MAINEAAWPWREMFFISAPVDFEQIYGNILLVAFFIHKISLPAQVLIQAYCGGLFTPESWPLFNVQGAGEPATRPVIRVEIKAPNLFQELQDAERRNADEQDGILVENDEEDIADDRSFMEAEELADNKWVDGGQK
jgi:hypothetical protein